MNEPTLPSTDNPGPNPNTGIGGNAPPAEYVIPAERVAAANSTVDAFIAATDIWTKQEVDTPELASQLADQVDGLTKLYKRVEATRVEIKKPADDFGKLVQATFTPILGRIDKAKKNLTPKLDEYNRKETARLAEIARLEKVEAERVAAEALRMRQEAEALVAEGEKLTIDEQIAIEQAENDAKEAEKQAKKASKEKANVKSYSGGGRTYSTRAPLKEAKIENIRHLFMHYQDHPKVHEILQSLANQECRSAGFEGTIPGCTILNA